MSKIEQEHDRAVMGRKTKDNNLKSVQESIEDEIFFLLNKMTSDSLEEFGKNVNTIFLEILAKSMSSKEVIAWRDKRMAQIIKETPSFATSDLLEKFDNKLLEKKRAEFTGIKGGARPGVRRR